MTKRGHFRKNWLKRWFVLTDEYLFYFDEAKTEMKGYIPLSFASVSREAPSVSKTTTQTQCIKLYSPIQKKDYYICVCDNF